MKKEGEESGNKESDIQTKEILKKCNALLNSGGGLLEMRISDPQNSSTSKKDPVDSFWHGLENELIKMTPPSVYGDVFDRRLLPGKILLFINTPLHFCTMKYNLFLPGDAGVYEAPYEKVKFFLSDGCEQDLDSNIRVPLEELPKVPDLFHERIISLNEGKQVQFKKLNSVLFKQTKQRFMITKQLSAFGNGDGGVLLIGVGDERKVYGVDMRKNTKEYIEACVISLFNEIYCNFELKRGIHWDLTFSNVSGGPENSFVIVIKMAGLKGSGGIFASFPKSFELQLNQNGQLDLKAVKFDKWKERMKSDDTDLTGNTKGVY